MAGEGIGNTELDRGGIQLTADISENHMLAVGQFGVIFESGTLEVLHQQPIGSLKLIGSGVAVKHRGIGNGVLEPQKIPLDIMTGLGKITGFMTLCVRRRPWDCYQADHEEQCQQAAQQHHPNYYTHN